MRGTGPALLLRRSWSVRGHLILLGVLTVLATGLIVGAPRLTNHLTDAGLHDRVSGLAYQVRDLTYQHTADPAVVAPPQSPGGWLAQQEGTFVEPLAGLIQDRWYAAQVGPEGLAATSAGGGEVAADLPFNGVAPPAIGLRHQTGVRHAVALTEGGWPAATPGGRNLVQAAASVDVARAMGLRVGSRFALRTVPPRGDPLQVEIVGLFTADDETAAVWDQESELLHPYVPVGRDNDPYRGVLVVDEIAIRQAIEAGIAGAIQLALPGGRRAARRRQPRRADRGGGPRPGSTRPREPPPRRAWTRCSPSSPNGCAAARALLAVVQTGVLATLLRPDAARGAARRWSGAGRSSRCCGRAAPRPARSAGARLTEALLVVPAGAAIGWLAAVQVPGRPGGDERGSSSRSRWSRPRPCRCWRWLAHRRAASHRRPGATWPPGGRPRAG